MNFLTSRGFNKRYFTAFLINFVHFRIFQAAEYMAQY